MNKGVLLVVMLLLGSCRLQDKKYQTPTLETPATWPNYPVSGDTRQKEEKQWWKGFNDPVLDGLVQEALGANSDILTAVSNVSKARAQLKLDEAQVFPEIDLQGGATRTKNSKQKPVNSFSLAAVLNYEVDLWGSVANSAAAAKALSRSAESTRDAVQLTVISNVVIAYFNILAIEKQLGLVRELISAQEKIYELNKKLFQAGTSDIVSLNQAESALVTARAQLPPLKQSLEEQKTALGILLGKSPAEIIRGIIKQKGSIDKLPSCIVFPQVLPSELLARRPDIRAAEQNLIASDAQIEVARAAYFPSISLTGLIGVGSNKLNSLFNNSSGKASAGASLAGPIIDFGRTGANVKIAKENREYNIIQYQQVIRTAFQEVMNFLSAYQTSGENFKLAEKNEQAQEVVMKLTRQRYSHGILAYPDVLNTEQILLQAKLNKINTKLNQLTATVNLFYALGGDWKDNTLTRESN